MKRRSLRTMRRAAPLLAVLLAPASVAAENLLENAEFDSDVAGWSCEETGAVCSWSSDDAAADPASGSGQVVRAGAGSFRGQLVQCVALTGALAYRVGAALRTIATNGRNGQLDVRWYEEPGCAGSSIDLDIVDAIPAAPGWTPIEALLTPPPGAQSLKFTVIAFAMEAETQTVQVDAAFVPEPAPATGALIASLALGWLRRRGVVRR